MEVILIKMFGLHRRGQEPYFEKYTSDKPNISDYINNRFEKQINWYHQAATRSRIIFYICQALIIVFGAIIPIANVAANTDSLAIRITSSVLGSLITIITGFLQLAKAQENWLLFRSTAENLKQEYHLFMQGGGEYSNPNLSSEEKNQLFIDRAEAIMTAEGSRYFTLRQSPKKVAEGGAASTS